MPAPASNAVSVRSRRLADDDRAAGESLPSDRSRSGVAVIVYGVSVAGILAAGSIAVVWLGTLAADPWGLGGILVVWMGEIGLAAVTPILARRGVGLIGLDLERSRASRNERVDGTYPGY